jgi:hypothetical protein
MTLSRRICTDLDGMSRRFLLKGCPTGMLSTYAIDPESHAVKSG